ncbi:MAG TPA: GatB/YqeY domain-containing protein [Syntrophobacteraceae bacterium]|nr:GatB/YqeY domain-containing protein [Syntrophobacteraceae bacterium]
MELHEKIDEALKKAMREKNETAKDALRLLLTSLKLKEKEIRRQPDETEIYRVISSLIKQRQDSIEQYQAGGRADLATKEEDEIRILQDFMPQQLSSEELEKMVEEAVGQAGAVSLKEMGRVMKILMPKVGGRAEGKLVNELVRRRLG